MRNLLASAVILTFIMIFTGCSTTNPSIPTGNTELPDKSDSSRLIGSGRVEFDTANQTLNVIPDRDNQYHFNITWLLNSSCPGGCFTWEIVEIDNDYWTIEMTIENPTSIQVWDVRIFLFNILGTEVMNPDGYSDYYTDVVWVPFINFYKEDPERAFPVGPDAFDTELLMLDFTNSSGGEVSYYIEAGIDEQFAEPVQIDPPETDGVFFSNYQPGGRVTAYVHDHQGDGVVSLDASLLGLAIDEPMYDDGLHGDELENDGIFGTDILIPTVETGTYTAYVEAYDAPGWPKIKRPIDIKVYPVPEMISIPAGTFQMGNGPSDPFNTDDRVADEKPLHDHSTDPYDIGKYEITVGEYAAFVENGGYYDPDYWSEAGWLMREDFGLMQPVYWEDTRFCGPDKQDHPMIGLSWYEAEAFCIWLSAVTGESWRLPSEAEWERAARGDDDDRPYPWGMVWDDHKCNTTRDNVDTSRTSPVGLYSPDGDSPWGCADMLGNANEWTADWYKSDIYTQYEQGDFTPPTNGSSKVARGAVWWTGWKLYIRNSFRWNMAPVGFDDANGFRIVRDVLEQ